MVPTDRSTREAIQLEGVVEVHEVMTGDRIIEVKAVFPRHDEVTQMAKELDATGLDIESEELIKRHYFRPFNHFGTGAVSDDEGRDEDEGVYEL